jgi:hypothetical protein
MLLQWHNVSIGEDSVFSVTAKTTNKTIENAMMVSRGITVFNKVQDAAQIKPTQFLPHVLSKQRHASASHNFTNVSFYILFLCCDATV